MCCFDILNVFTFLTAQFCALSLSLSLHPRTCWQVVWEGCSPEASERRVLLTLAAIPQYLHLTHGLEDLTPMLAPGDRLLTALRWRIPNKLPSQRRRRSTTPEAVPPSAPSDERSRSVKFTWSARPARAWAPCTVQTWSSSWTRRASSWCCSASARIPPSTGWWAASRCTRSSWNSGRNRKPNLVCTVVSWQLFGAFVYLWV